MTFITPPAWQQGGTYSARTDRLSIITGLLGYHGNSGDEASLRTRSGVRPSYQHQHLAVTAQGTPNMTVNVAAGICYVQNKDLANYGAYTLVNDSPITLTIAASSGTQFRRDTVVVQVLDAETLGVVNSASAVVVQGPYAATAGGTSRGTIPPNSIILADIAVDAGVTSIPGGKISDARQYQVAAGGILPATAATVPDHLAPGQMVYGVDSDTFYYGTLAGTTKQLPIAGSTAVGSVSHKDKTSAQAVSSATTGTTLINDTELALVVAANARYEIETCIIYDGPFGAGDLKADWGIPAAASMVWALNGPTTGGGALYDSAVRTVGVSSAVAGTYGTGGTPTSLASRGRLTTGINAGSLQFRWAQGTANATNTTVYPGSWIRLHRIA